MATEPASAHGGFLLTESVDPIGSVNFVPTKVSIATSVPVLLCRVRLTWGTLILKSIGEGRLQYASTQGGDTNYYNIAKGLAAVNARNEEITDRQGNLYGYWCRIETTSTANDLLALAWVPNTWKVRNAFRKFHFAREHMFREAGVTKKEMGKYGRTIRPYFSQDHQTSGDESPRSFDPGTLTAVNLTGGEWTYTKLASSPTLPTGDVLTEVEDLGLVDEWSLTILDSHRVESTVQSGVNIWTSVAMVQAYNQDRMEEIPDATADSSIVSPNNPLAALRSQDLTSGSITEIAEDQELEAPPYDITDSGDSTEACFDYMPMGGTTAGSTASIRNWGLYFFPAGIIALQNSVTGSNALEITVIGKELCKDVA